MICCRNNDHKIELPLLMKYTSARRHDSISFLYAVDKLGRHEPFWTMIIGICIHLDARLKAGKI